MKCRAVLLVCAVLLVSLASGVLARRQAPARVASTDDAIRLNNLGVASMNQQKPEVALERFEAAAKADASLVAARVNQAIAMTALQRYEPAQQILDAIVKADAANVRAWYSLGLLTRTLGDSDAALAAFTRAAELSPNDAYAHYFVGLISSQLQQHEKAIAAFSRALQIDPFLVSAEFGLARSYQRSGKPDDAKTHMDRFTRLTQEKIASAMSLSYGDQGPLSLAQAVLPVAGAATAAIPVRFVADAAMVTGRAAGLPRPLGSCVIDGDGDGVLERVDIGLQHGARIARRNPNGEWTPSAQLAGPGVVECAVGDYDNDERPDIALVIAPGGSRSPGVVLVRNLGEGRFASPLQLLTSPPATLVTSVTFVDLDHDADLDVVAMRVHISGEAAAVVLRNNGDGTFTDVTVKRGLGVTNAQTAIASDVDNDRAVDLVFAGQETLVFINPREGAFRQLEPFGRERSGTRVAVVLDFDKDGWMDLAFGHGGAPAVTLWRNRDGKGFEQVDVPESSLLSASGLTAIDFDNDGWIDLSVSGLVKPSDQARASPDGAIRIWRNVQGRFEDVSPAVGVATLAPTLPGSLAAADVDGDNDADLLLMHAGGAFTVLVNDGGNANASVRIALLGLNDNRSGLGTKVEVQAGTMWQKFETSSATGPELLAGIGKATQADVVRLLWPTGVVQDEVELKANTRHAITQIDRRGSSCPVLFSWNGERYEFVADAIGPAVVGHWVAPNTRNISDVDELVKVEGRQVKVKDGRVSFRFAEPMEEVIYLDQVKLFAVDHPEGTDVYPNEYFAALPPHPVDRPLASRGARLPVGAWDHQGRDVMPALETRDRRFVEIQEGARQEGATSALQEGATSALQEGATSVAPRRSPPYSFKGFAPLHALELDLGDLAAGAPVRLLMHGFTDYFTATSVFAAHQAKVTAVLPWVEAQKADGSWTRISDDIGFPAGLLRTMTADLTGKLPADARRIRIWTNLKIYWDQILVDTTPDGAVPVRRTEIPLAEASLAFRGFPREVTGTPAADLQYVHGEVSKYGPYARHRGFYTKYGAVTPLLKAAENQFVVFGAGDEVALEFDAAALPPLPAGWTRDYFVYFNGYVKDMDFYAAHAQTVGPLPFKGMPGYPYPAGISYPDRNREYQLEWNTREVVGESWPSYQFSFRHNDDDTTRRNPTP